MNLFSNLKLKDFIILILMVITIVFFIFFMYRITGYKKEIKRIKIENRIIQKLRDNLEIRKDSLEKKEAIYIKDIKIYKNRIDSVDKIIYLKNLEIRNLKKSTEEYRKEYNKTKAEINDLDKSKDKKTGSYLLNSIKENTK